MPDTTPRTPGLEEQMYEDYTEARPCVIEGEPDAQTVWLRVGGQQFCVTPHACDNAEEAEWTRRQLATALARLAGAAPVEREGRERTVYTASRSKHAHRWRELRSAGHPIISSWIDEAGEGETSDWGDLWRRCLEEAKGADVLILYAEEGETLRGALLEAGAALTAGRRVIYVGPDATLNNVLRHPGIERANSVDAALAVLTPTPEQEPSDG